MTWNDARAARLLVDRAAAETPQLHWIAPLALIANQMKALEAEGAGVDEALLDRCERVAEAAASGESMPPDLPRKLLFGLLDAGEAGCDADELRTACDRCAGLLRAAREARPLFRRAWRDAPEAVRREEAIAFEQDFAELEATFDQLLHAREEAIRAEDVRRRTRQARAAQEALTALPVPRPVPEDAAWMEEEGPAEPAPVRPRAVSEKSAAACADI